MAEALVSSILERLATITIENARQELKLVIDVEQEMVKLQTNFKAIQCVLENAEEKQLVHKNVRLWLEGLKEVSYDIEDVLDEWKTAILKSKMDGAEEVNVRRKVCSWFSCFASCRQVVRRHDIASKIKQINEALDVIAKQKDRYQFAKSSEIKQPRRRESTSFIDVSELHGRDDVKSKIVSTLLDGNGIHTISIVGMGGIGKTALTQLIFNDPKVKANFNHVIWVCVSDFFDQYKIGRAILGGLNKNSINLQNPISLQDVLTEIGDKIKSSKFLLVLDDVWTDHDEDWQPLKVVFRQGMSGSKVLLTTRKESIATGMGSSRVFHLEELSDEICWLILSQVAFVGKNNYFRGDLEDIGREIAKKCRGLPLVAKNLGSLLREKNTRKDWQIILNSEIWKLNVAKEYIYTPLLLSYYDLPSEIRPCLLYCAIFPKDFVIHRDELIKHWMSHGYLNMDESFGMEEEKGEEYLNYLASRSFFQDFKKDGHGNIIKCKMHDLIHDFVQYLANEVMEVELNNSENLKLDFSSKKTHHLRAMIAEIDQFPMIINGIEKLRSLVVVSQMCCATGEALQALFKTGKCLRVLDFALDWHWFSWKVLNVKQIPNEIKKLIHLRYLNLRGSKNLEELPEVVCELYNLQHLNLSGCYHLKKLPDDIGKLINLRSLDTLNCTSLVYHPKGIGRLSSLKELTFVIARIDGNNAKEFSIGDLENLDLLRGSSSIKLVGNAIDLEETKRARMDKKIHLNTLDMRFRDFEARDDCRAFHQALSPPPSVKCALSTSDAIIL